MIYNNRETKNVRTIIMAGVNGDIGQEFVKKLSPLGKIYGISRTPKKSEADYTHIRANFLNSKEVKTAFSNISFSDDILYFHLIGKFRFEDSNHPITDKNRDGIDDEIYETNVATFKNVRPILLDFLESNHKARLKIVAIGSASDIYEIPFWKSFTLSKDELRKEFRLLYGYPIVYGRVSALFINVSTVSGAQLTDERPFITREFCLSPRDIINQSMPYILDTRPSFLEMTVIKPNPAFMSPNYLSSEQIRERWYRDMYGNSKDKELKGGKTK